MNRLPLFNDPNVLIAAVVGGIMLLAIVVSVWRVWRQRFARSQLHRSIRQIGLDARQDVLVPDGMGGWLHVEFLLLTPQGVLIVELRDIRGNLFGGDQMSQWTVMDGPRRSTFLNPQSALFDRIAAVKALAGELPVEGRLVFSRRSVFPKGLPNWTMMLESLQTQYPRLDAATRADLIARQREPWDALCATLIDGGPMPGPSFLREVFLS